MKDPLWNKKFSHIYVETEIRNHPKTLEILSHFSSAVVIEIQKYKDIFNRKHQSNRLQYQSQSLILAKKSYDFLYNGSPVCQSFNEEYFYYCSNVMNCVYDCEYCFLKGMYGSSNIVVFVNLEEYFTEIEKVLQQHPLYVCASYDTDLLALEPYLGVAKQWGEFARNHPDFLVEIRTKGTSIENVHALPAISNCIVACTISSDYVQRKYEHHTPSLDARLALLQQMMQEGYSVRVCLDPVIPVGNWKEDYGAVIEKLVNTLDIEKVRDFSIGTFRISKEYMKTMREQYPCSGLLQYPYVCENGFYHLPHEKDVEVWCKKALMEKGVREEKIFIWKE